MHEPFVSDAYVAVVAQSELRETERERERERRGKRERERRVRTRVLTSYYQIFIIILDLFFIIIVE